MMGGIKRERQRAQYRGKRAEFRAAWWLRLKGYRILARNWRSPYGEIDIVAQKGSFLVVVEVKNRRRPDLLPESILTRQRQRLRRAALFFHAQHHLSTDLTIRFDAILAGGLLLRHLPGAWVVDG